MPVHDFLSDTVTLPTPAMMEAIVDARLGDAARGDDPTVRELEALVRELTGKDDALLVPSGVMANLAALIGWRCRGADVIAGADAHLLNAEGGGLSEAAGGIACPIEGDHGILSAESIRAEIERRRASSQRKIALVCLENTHNAGGGTVYPAHTMAAVHAVTARAGIPLHLDGARLFNAAAYLNTPIRALCEHVDSVWFSLCKGLGGPIGAMLAGEREFMQAARRAAKMLGGGMRQAGIIAAPAIVALANDPYARLARDHVLARRLAAGLGAIDPSLVDVDRVQTNIVNCFVDRYASDASGIHRALRDRGVRTLYRKSKIRFVTHSDVDEADVDVAIAAFADVIAQCSRRKETTCRS